MKLNENDWFLFGYELLYRQGEIKMFTEERHNIILRELKIKGMISVNDLVKLLNHLLKSMI